MAIIQELLEGMLVKLQKLVVLSAQTFKSAVNSSR